MLNKVAIVTDSTAYLPDEFYKHLAATHANCDTDARVLLEAARSELAPVETMICPLSPVMGAHVGPGTFALNYMSEIA